MSMNYKREEGLFKYLDNELYWLWLCNIEGVWRGIIEKLLMYFNKPIEIFNADEKDLANCVNKFGIKEEILKNIIESRDYRKIDDIKMNLENKNINFCSCENKKFPEKLKVINECPYGIYLKGNNIDFDKKSVAIVGARNCTTYGMKMAYDIGFKLALSGINVISGMARGIDSKAHLGTIDGNGKTLAVLGCGVDVCYPRENIDLYEKILENGMIISEFPIKSSPLSWKFPIRNRIISGLADKIIIVEARERSGSLITAEYALEQGKDVYAIPGRTQDSLSMGCNRLIKDGAGIICSTETVLEDLGFFDFYNSKKSRNKNIVLEKDLESLYSMLDFFPKSLEQLIMETEREPKELLRDLIRLEMMGFIDEPTRNYYVKKI